MSLLALFSFLICSKNPNYGVSVPLYWFTTEKVCIEKSTSFTVAVVLFTCFLLGLNMQVISHEILFNISGYLLPVWLNLFVCPLRGVGRTFEVVQL